MRKFWINSGFVILAIVLFACGNSENNQVAPVLDSLGADSIDTTTISSAIQPNTYTVSLGDINNDNKADTIIVVMPETNDADMTCKDSSCTTYFAFEKNAFPSFSQEQALGGSIGNAGDLDDDGICELYFVPDWFTSNWSSFNIYSLKNNEWKRIANATIRRDESEGDSTLFMSYDKRIIKHNKEYFEIVENVMNEDGEENLVPNKFYFK